MDLSAAFGSAFVFSDAKRLGATRYPHMKPAEQTTLIQEPLTPAQEQEPTTTMNYSRIPENPEVPEVYILNVQIGRDDCHLMCMFLLVFTISFILGSRR